MGVPSYVCASCGEHFTRKTSAKRHNSNLHNNNGEIVPILEYLAGRSSNRQFLYRKGRGDGRKRIHNFERTSPVAAVADSMGDTATFRRGVCGMQGQGQGQYHPYLQQQQRTQIPSPYPTATADQISHSQPQSQFQTYSQPKPQPTKTRNDWGISEDTRPKFVEFKRLLYGHPTTIRIGIKNKRILFFK